MGARLSLETTVPIGMISPFSGAIIPAGWFLCDGNNGTPDLRNRFIRGASPGETLGSTSGGGGTAIAPNTDPLDYQIALTVDQLPSHLHTVSLGRNYKYRDEPWPPNPFGSTASEPSTRSVSFTSTAVTRATASVSLLPQYYILRYVMKSPDVATTNMIPTGLIVAFTGSTAPPGWALCNGDAATPNLQNRFVRGFDPNRGVSEPGGSDTITLQADQIPPHTHSITLTQGYHYKDEWHAGTPIVQANNRPFTTTHTTTAVGGGGAIDIRPPYYELAYIMKI